MIKLGTLSDKLNHTADCKESIRQAVNQNLGGAELISPSTQFDQYSNYINSKINIIHYDNTSSGTSEFWTKDIGARDGQLKTLTIFGFPISAFQNNVETEFLTPSAPQYIDKAHFIHIDFVNNKISFIGNAANSSIYPYKGENIWYYKNSVQFQNGAGIVQDGKISQQSFQMLINNAVVGIPDKNYFEEIIIILEYV